MFRMGLEKEKYITVEKDGKTLGTYAPGIMSLFVNASIYEVEETEEERYKFNKRVYFHELYHNWQSLFTPFGQLRWFTEYESTNRLVEVWEKKAREDSRFRKIPIAHLADSEFEECVAFAQLLRFLSLDIELIKIMQYGYVKDELCLFEGKIPNYISPTIIYHDQEYVINGIDIIESFDKYQEALYGEYVNGEDFRKVLDIEKLSETYYIPLLYYIDQVGDAKAFPIACEIALMTNSIGDITNECNWKNNSPAWRFCKVVQLMKEDKNMPCIQIEKMNQTYLEVVNYVLEKCEYKNYRDAYQELYKEITEDWSDPLIHEMNLALNFKLQYPGMLSYPFLCDKECVDKMYMFEPHFLRYTNISMPLYKRDEILYGKVGGNKNKWKSRLSVELHRKALAYQIMGIISQRTIYHDVLLCGCGYFGIDDCPFYNRGCNGCLESDSELKYSFDDIENVKSLIKKIKKERRDENIDNYEKNRMEQDLAGKVDCCLLDMIYVIINGFSITDISVDFKRLN